MNKQAKKEFEKIISDEYPGVSIEWHRDNPTLVIPDRLESESEKIVKYFSAVWSNAGGEVKFYPEKAIHTDG